MEYGKGNRICYVDPNDVRGNINGVPLTPDYTDFTIWCNLIVEGSTRANKDTYQQSGNNNNFYISWNLTSADGNHSFFSGKEIGDYNFLTTDYTNIDYSEIKDRTIIEGLQIENIDINFVNYQSPQVTIKFIDIRGGGFFGREEATHDEYGQLKNLSRDKENKIIDNFYACFVSFPYPKFKLQVKGFYGKPVTFQLTCSSFNGNFNSQTGNFEITVQFIGYEYGLLGDIPFSLLVYAPKTVFGGKYWNEHVNSEKWALDNNGAKPRPLYEFFEAIKSEMAKTDGNTDLLEGNNTKATVLTGIQQQINLLNEIKTSLLEFQNNLKNTFESVYTIDCTDSDSESVFIIFNNSNRYRVTQDICNQRNEIKKLVETYNASYSSDSGGISSDIIPNFVTSNDTDWVSGDVLFTNFVNNDTEILVSTESNTQKDKLLDSNLSAVGAQLNKFYNNETYTITESVASKLYTELSKRLWFTLKNKFYTFANVITFGGGEAELNNKILQLNNEYTNLLYNLESNSQDWMMQKIQVLPYIGRFYKMVMCHLETFVAFFNESVQQIYKDIDAGRRKPELLGIKSLDLSTDAPSDTFSKGVPPFPAVYKGYNTTAEADNDLNGNDPQHSNDIVKDVWIGDFRGHWVEKRMVDEIYKAAINDGSGNGDTLGTFNTQTGSYNNKDFNPFTFIYDIPGYAYDTVDGALLFIALQAEITLHILQDSDINPENAKKWGEYNAYIFAKNEASGNGIVSKLNTIPDLGAYLYNSTVGEDAFLSNQTQYEYEFTHRYNGRHPIFIPIKDKDYLKYNYITTKLSDLEFIPVSSVRSIQNSNPIQAEYNIDENENITPRYPESANTFIVNGSTNTKVSKYNKTNQFGLFDTNMVNIIQNLYNDFTKGNVKIGKKLSKEYVNILKNCVLVDKARYEIYHETAWASFIKYSDYNKTIRTYQIDINKINDVSLSDINKLNNIQKYLH